MENETETENIERHVKILDKPFSELTMRDNIKINLAVVGVTVAAGAIYGGVVALREARQQRKLRKEMESLETSLYEIKTTEDN